MPDRTEIARQTAAGLRRFGDQRAGQPVLLGFDGFVDSIISVVDKRHDLERFEPIPTIEQFGRKIVSAAGQSSNYELVVRLQKLGGNGPIMSNALAALGLCVNYIGSLGRPTIHPVFQEFSQQAKCYSIAEPGLTDALEFQDGKVMLGKHAALRDVCWPQIIECVGLGQFRQLVSDARLIGMVNWTMLPCLSEIWRHVIDEILAPAQGFPSDARSPSTRQTASDQTKANHGLPRQLIFIDLADPEKRTWADLRQALDLCTEFQQYADVVMGLNLKEAVQVASALDLETPDRPHDAIELLSRGIREQLQIQTVVVHPRAAAAACTCVEGDIASALFAGPFTSQPRISTGAGDNFNAGFCFGQLAQLSLAESLCTATALSGFYVREARSPELEELIKFIEALPPPDGRDRPAHA
ncbi:MAG: PfkB family carbohydrate kinase [Pirellulales bacterium]